MDSLPRVHPTVVHMLVEAAGRASDREALVCGDERLTYSEYLRCVAGFAHELVALGASGGRVAIVLGNSTDLCVAMFGAHAARAQAVPLNPAYTERELRRILEDAMPWVVLYDDASSTAVEAVADALAIARRIHIGPRRRLDRWRDQAAIELPQPLPEPADLATLQYTGGTTGRAKGVNLTHGAIAVNISQREALVPARPDMERLLCVMPLFHVYAVAMCLHNMAYCRGTLVIVDRYRPETVFALLERERITIFAGSPTLFSGLMNHADFGRTDFSSLHLCYSGSAALPGEVLRRWEAGTGAPVIEGYGQTEAGPVISFNPLQGLRKPGSVGIALPQCDVQVVDYAEERHVLAPGEQGEIRVRGPQLMSGYRNLSGDTAEALREGWLYTGDIGTFDEDGYLYIRDRKKDMIIVSGYNVYPREVEEVLYMHDAVLEAAVVGVPDSYRGEIVKALVVLRAAVEATPDDLVRHCAANLARYKVPAIVELVTELPRTRVGKIDKARLRSDRP